MKSEVIRFFCSCHVCHISGKINQTIPVTPLWPILVIEEQFEHLTLDCVGPLPETLPLLSATTYYPEAIPLRTLKAKAVVKALTNFFSTCGFPK